MLHVELIHNEWAAGRQLVVARLTLNGTRELRLESADDDVWRQVIMRPFVDRASGEEIDPDRDPETFITSLHDHLTGDYLFATEAHEQGECEYHIGQPIPLSTITTDAPQPVA